MKPPKDIFYNISQIAVSGIGRPSTTANGTYPGVLKVYADMAIGTFNERAHLHLNEARHRCINLVGIKRY
jgi:hypothetical protein